MRTTISVRTVAVHTLIGTVQTAAYQYYTDGTNMLISDADPDPWNPYNFPGSGSV